MTYFHSFLAISAALLLGAQSASAAGDGDHAHADENVSEVLREMEELHDDHDHGHDFEAIEELSEEDMQRTMDLLSDLGLVVPIMNSARGAGVFMEKGCIACHAVNGVGGQIGPSFDAADMPSPMNAFDFSARMWRGAPAMAQMQEDLFGEMITITGQELADIIAFVHDAGAQATVSAADVPDAFREFLPE